MEKYEVKKALCVNNAVYLQEDKVKLTFNDDKIIVGEIVNIYDKNSYFDYISIYSKADSQSGNVLEYPIDIIKSIEKVNEKE